MKYLFILCSLLPIVVHSEIYKCQNNDENVLFSDFPCTNNYKVIQVINNTEEIDTNWQTELINKDIPSIEILEVVETEGETAITYSFIAKSDYTNFMI
jgi:hypothetical protein